MTFLKFTVTGKPESVRDNACMQCIVTLCIIVRDGFKYNVVSPAEGVMPARDSDAAALRVGC